MWTPLVDDVRDAMEATERHQVAKREAKDAREGTEVPQERPQKRKNVSQTDDK
jgi:hypothetical protein